MMKKELWVNSTLTLLTMFALSACGSSGGKAPSAMPASRPTPEAEQQKPSAPEVEKKEEKEPEQSQANLSVEKSKAEESKAEKLQQPKVAPVAEQPKKEEQKQPQATQPVEKPKAEEPKAEQPQVNPPAEQPKAEEPKAEQPQVNPPAEQPKTEEPKAEQPQVNPPVEKPQPDSLQADLTKMEKPQQPPVPRLVDKDVFDRLRLYDKNGTVYDLIKLIFNENNKKVELSVLQPHSFAGTPKMETLRDNAGTLVGYYGYARVSEQKKDINKENYNSLSYFYLQDVDQSMQQRPVGMGDIKYSGKMLYQYNADSRQQEADVSAIYHVGEKKMSMNIHDNFGGLWTLREMKTVRSNDRVGVREDGSVGGYLFFHNNEGEKPKFNGNFNGGFYGKDGSVLTGRASFEDKKGGWEGVIGATAKKADKANQ
ncbi:MULTISPECIES: hypothetical protein [unclassified Neisseria]|uniref:hypothetical protein n=1 Tax=unclassified Neisseria TaxID=2623750 RepID=UPI002665E890|nr:MULTISPECIES: hypothetical protein [unclassified Neisseria]MDO1510072.1 hypothetical protein [Neisseria sp. MVDL19-042950]MDO1516898.1 hypothetical protein [Neisseria sp. MVDL18-041461]MDO1564183.1 hypothetical protein [Neisseria sp. MVDL20-010259]